jgi:DNA repair exonuclease SbcCD nuclease subunit
MKNSELSRRRFIQGLAGLLAASRLEAFGAAPAQAEPFRFAFLTDLHLMPNGALRSAAGIATCLQAVEELNPGPDFILVGGDLVNDARDMSILDANRGYDLFLKTWHANTGLPAFWTFGNHDLCATGVADPPIHDPRYGKGLFKQRLGLSKLFYSFDHRGWHFVVLDDIALMPDKSYEGLLFDDELAYLRADLQAHGAKPTIVCTHIPLFSIVPFSIAFAQATGFHVKSKHSLVCTNASAAINDFPGHNIRAVLAGHLHHYELNVIGGVPFYNSGAVCGNYWKGPMGDCQEGFAVIDLSADGSLKFDYRGYGWKA